MDSRRSRIPKPPANRARPRRWRMQIQLGEAQELAEAGFAEYLTNLVDYESLLCCGKVKW